MQMDLKDGFEMASKLLGALNLYLQEKGALPTRQKISPSPSFQEMETSPEEEDSE